MQVPTWITEELARLQTALNSTSEVTRKQAESLLLPIHVCGKADRVAFVFLPNAANMATTPLPQAVAIAAMLPVGFTELMKITTAVELGQFLEQAKPIDAAFLSTLDAASSFAVEYFDISATDRASESSSTMNIIQNQDFEVVAASSIAQCFPLPPGSCFFSTPYSQQNHLSVKHQGSAVFFQRPGEKLTAANYAAKAGVIAAQTELAGSLKNDGTGKMKWDAFWPQLSGQWCPIAAPVSPTALRIAYHRALLLPPCPHLNPKRSLLSRLQESATKQYEEFELNRNQQRKFKSVIPAGSGSGSGCVGESKAIRNFPALQTVRKIRSSGSILDAALLDPHKSIPPERSKKSTQQQQQNQRAVVRGSYRYYHYCVDGFDDRGWGCAYRSMQTLISWFALQCDFTVACGPRVAPSKEEANRAMFGPIEVPSIVQIQRTLDLVDPDKQAIRNFVGSKEWIGSIEVMLVLKFILPELECTIKRIDKGSQFVSDPAIARMLLSHFERSACPVMIGGASYAQTILGIDLDTATGEYELLILDPHYVAANNGKQPPSLDTVVTRGWCGWKKPAQFFDQAAWYNLCLPVVTGMSL